ncbi:MAG: MFS transporter [Burkholderiaceae bacterium]
MPGPRPPTGTAPVPTADQPAAGGGFFTHEQIMAVLPGLVLVMFLAALDQTIVAIALYSIALDLRGEALMPWLVSGYLVVATVATPIYGKLSDLYGRWPVLRSAIFIFLAASLLSTIATSMPQLLAFRLLQGLGGGGLIVLVQTIVADIVPRQQRGRYQAYLSGVFAVAAVAGPVVGGLLTEYFSWRAVFAFNLPLGLAAWLITRRSLIGLPRSPRAPSIDYAGALLLTVALGTLMLALMLLGRGSSPATPAVAGLLVAAAVAFAALAVCERRASDPILPPDLFANRTVMICCAVLGINFLVLYGCTILVPLSIQTVGGLRAGWLALFMLPLTLGVPIGSYVSGKAMQGAMRHRLLLGLGSALTATGALLLALDAAHAGWVTAIGLAVTGCGIGMCIPSTIVAVQAAVPLRQIGIATATSGVFRTLGGAIGIAAMSAMLFATLATAPSGLAGGLRGGTVVTELAALPQALLASGFQRAFLLAAGVATVAIVLSRLLRHDGAGAAH